MNKELRNKRTVKFFKKLWDFVSHHNAFVIALELTIFIGIVFAFVASNYNPLNKQFNPEGILSESYGTGNQQLTNPEELKEQEKELGEHYRILAEVASTLKPGETKEVIRLRNETSKTYASGEGKVIWEGTVGPIHYQDNPNDPNGEWKEIDTTIEEIEGQYQVTKAPYKATFLTQPGYIYQSKEVKGDWIQVKLEGLESWDSSSRVIENNKITYSNVFTDTDAEITAGNTGVQFNLILQSPQAPTQFSFDIESGNSPKNGLNWQSFSMRDLTGYDAKGKPLDIDWDFDQSSGKITLAVDTTNAVYPLTIDPTVDKQVGASSDDTYEQLTPPYLGVALTYHYIGSGGTVSYQFGSGLRFTNITIPQGSTIDQAYLTHRCYDSTSCTVVNTRISAEDVDDAPTFADDKAAFDARWAARTTARVDWDNIPAWTIDTNYNSPEIKTVIKEIVDRVGWVSGNDIVIFWEDFEDRSTHSLYCYKAVYSYDGSTTYAPKLYIEYTPAAEEERRVMIIE